MLVFGNISVGGFLTGVFSFLGLILALLYCVSSLFDKSDKNDQDDDKDE